MLSNNIDVRIFIFISIRQYLAIKSTDTYIGMISDKTVKRVS